MELDSLIFLVDREREVVGAAEGQKQCASSSFCVTHRSVPDFSSSMSGASGIRAKHPASARF